MDPLIGAGLISAGSGLIGGLLSNSASAKAAEEAGKAARDLWRMQAEYNTPANQVARLRAAGLNPNLIYGNGSTNTGNMSSAPQFTEPAKKDYSFLQAIDKVGIYLQMKNLQQTNENLRAQTDDIKAQTRQRNAQADYDNAVLEFYRKHGYFPGQTSAPTNVVSEIKRQVQGSSIAAHSAEALGTFVGNITSNYDSSPDRAQRMAIQAADRKKLSGRARADYIDRFVAIYNKTH